MFKTKQKRLISMLLIVAKLLIAVKWKSNVTPTIYEWLTKCWAIMIMDKLTTMAHAFM